uniref:Putative secreted protein ovary overexpressed n=1 Tax=Rhipicephalus microplus TaxID=6941 RepID=A0A6M2DAU9_RHIMP
MGVYRKARRTVSHLLYVISIALVVKGKVFISNKSIKKPTMTITNVNDKIILTKSDRRNHNYFKQRTVARTASHVNKYQNWQK